MDEILDNQDSINETQADTSEVISNTISLNGLYESWFLDYASYVILERAVPDIHDGLKPVQRRILHSMREMEDGRYNKVANIIGHTMKYHPHGDASIGDALVQLGQKELLIDQQGNWGNILTGDRAAAPRYIEARLSKFALEVVFNPKTTHWQASYDGRNREPIVLPIKFPLLLSQGVEGIAVGLASKILPHNFNELIDASISYLEGKSFVLYPDFITGGFVDVSRYNSGIRGGKVRIRAKISKPDKKTLVITDIPFSTNTGNVIDSILEANKNGKIKIKKIEDNTAENVEILIQLDSNISPDQTIDALYAFTKCEVSISPNSCVIFDNVPVFLGVEEMLRISTNKTVSLLKAELEIKRDELMEQWHFSSLEKIFIRERIYRDIEEAEDWEMALDLIDKGLTPFKHLFHREITRDDITRLTEIKIKRISKYNEFKADEYLKGIEDELEQVNYHLNHLIDYAIAYFKNIKKLFGVGRERKTEIRSFEKIDAASVAVSNVKLYANYEEGFMGTGLKKDVFVTECSDIDDVVVFRENGTFLVTKVSEKAFVGKNIIHIDVLKRNDDRTTYNLIYRDGAAGKNFVKRFAVVGYTRDREYDVTKGNANSKVLYLTVNPNGEAEIVKVKLRPRPNLRKLNFDFDFSTLSIKGRGANGNILTKYTISKISLKEDGISTLGAMDIWFDEAVKRLNAEGRGRLLGAFSANDRILSMLSSGHYVLTGFELTTHFEENMIQLNKYDEDSIWTCVYYEGESEKYFIKRFKIELSDKKICFISEHPNSKLIHISDENFPRFELNFKTDAKGKKHEVEIIDAESFIEEKGVKAKGKRLSTLEIKNVKMLEPLIIEEDADDSEDQEVEIDENDGFSEEEIAAINTVVKEFSVEEVDIPMAANRVSSVENTPSDFIVSSVEIIEEKEAVKAKKQKATKPAKTNPSEELKVVKPSVHSRNQESDDILELKEAPISKEQKKKEVKEKEVKPKPESKSIRTSLDSEEPLQFELSFD